MPAKRRGKPVLVALVVVAVVGLVLAAPGLFRLYDWMLDVSWPQVESTVTVDEKPVSATVHRSLDGRYVRIDYDTRLFVVDVEEKIIARLVALRTNS